MASIASGGLGLTVGVYTLIDQLAESQGGPEAGIMQRVCMSYLNTRINGMQNCDEKTRIVTAIIEGMCAQGITRLAIDILSKHFDTRAYVSDKLYIRTVIEGLPEGRNKTICLEKIAKVNTI